LPTAAPAIPQDAAVLAPIAPGIPEIAFPRNSSPAPDMAIRGGPMMQRGEHDVEVNFGYQQSGKIAIDGDTVTQQLGRGQTAEYSLSQLAAHSKDPAYFEATLRYAAERGDSVRIGRSGEGDMSVLDPALEHRLPQDIPLREPMLRASVMHNIDPVLLAAVGVQESRLGAGYMGSSARIGYNPITHRGDVEPDSPGGHGYGPFQYDDQKRGHHLGRPQAELDRVARDPYYAADKAAGMLADNLAKTNGNVSEALHLYNAGNLITPTSRTEWGPGIGYLPYEDSTMRFYAQIQERAAHERPGLQR
jgi:hypothetical protein